MERRKGVFFSYILMGIEMLSSILFTPFLIRSFGQEEYGIYSLVMSVTAYLTLLDMGVGNALVKYITQYRVQENSDKQKKLLAVSLCFYGIIGILILLIGYMVSFNMELLFGKGLKEAEIARAQSMFSITMVNVALTLLFSVFTKILIAYEKFVVQKCLEIIKILLRVGICVIVLLCGGKGLGIVKVNLGMTVLFGIIGASYVIINLKIIPRFVGMDFSFIKEIVGYSFFIFLQMIATQINAMVDQILIGAFVQGAAALLGIYAVGALINQYFQSIAMSVNGILMPGVVKLVEQKACVQTLLDEMVRIGRLLFILLGIIWTCFLVVGKAFIFLWAGEDNVFAYYIAVILMTPMMITLIQSIGTQILWAKNKHKLQAVLKIIVSLVNILLTVILIKWDALLGAAIGTAIAIFLGDIVVMNIVFSKDIGISMRSYYKRLCGGILPSIIITALLGFLLAKIIHVQNWLYLILVCGCMLVFYGIILFCKGMTSYEKNLLKSILYKVIKRTNI